jgi:hypothetical protein
MAQLAGIMPSGPPTHAITVAVPDEHVGAIVGRGGRTITEIQQVRLGVLYTRELTGGKSRGSSGICITNPGEARPHCVVGWALESVVRRSGIVWGV